MLADQILQLLKSEANREIVNQSQDDFKILLNDDEEIYFKAVLGPIDVWYRLPEYMQFRIMTWCIKLLDFPTHVKELLISGVMTVEELEDENTRREIRMSALTSVVYEFPDLTELEKRGIDDQWIRSRVERFKNNLHRQARKMHFKDANEALQKGMNISIRHQSDGYFYYDLVPDNIDL